MVEPSGHRTPLGVWSTVASDIGTSLNFDCKKKKKKALEAWLSIIEPAGPVPCRGDRFAFALVCPSIQMTYFRVYILRQATKRNGCVR